MIYFKCEGCASSSCVVKIDGEVKYIDNIDFCCPYCSKAVVFQEIDEESYLEWKRQLIVKDSRFFSFKCSIGSQGSLDKCICLKDSSCVLEYMLPTKLCHEGGPIFPDSCFNSGCPFKWDIVKKTRWYENE